MNISTTSTSTSSPTLNLKNYNSSPNITNINVESKIKNSTTIEMGLLNDDSSENSNKIIDSTDNDSLINSCTDEFNENSFIKGPWTAEVRTFRYIIID